MALIIEKVNFTAQPAFRTKIERDLREAEVNLKHTKCGTEDQFIADFTTSKQLNAVKALRTLVVHQFIRISDPFLHQHLGGH